MAVGFQWRWPVLSRRRLSPACRGPVSPPRSSNRQKGGSGGSPSKAKADLALQDRMASGSAGLDALNAGDRSRPARVARHRLPGDRFSLR